MFFPLEPRCLLSATLSEGQLFITGTAEDDVIVLSSISRKVVRVSVNGQTNDFPAQGIRSIHVHALAGDDRVEGRRSSLPLRINGGLGSDTLKGGSSNDTLHGGQEKPVHLNGNTTGYASDILSGGRGSDTADYSGRTDHLFLSVGLGPGQGDGVQPEQTIDGLQIPGTGEFDLIAPDTENIIGGSGSDAIFGDLKSNRLFGGPGLDFLHGEGFDEVSPGDVFSGGPGKDTATYDSRSKGVRLFRDGRANDGARGESDNILFDIEIITGSRANDLLVGSPQADHMSGNFGNDTLLGLAGEDLLAGGPGRDSIAGGAGNDTLYGFDSLDAIIFPEDQIDTLSGGAGIDLAEIDPQDNVLDAEEIKEQSPLEPWPEPQPNPDN